MSEKFAIFVELLMNDLFIILYFRVLFWSLRPLFKLSHNMSFLQDFCTVQEH